MVYCIIQAIKIRIIWRFPEAAVSSEARLRMCFSRIRDQAKVVNVNVQRHRM
jgi:hypothetical protein